MIRNGARPEQDVNLAGSRTLVCVIAGPVGRGPKRSGCTLSPLNANQEESTPDATTELCRAAKLHPGVSRGPAAVPPGPGGADAGQPARAAGADDAGHG